MKSSFKLLSIILSASLLALSTTASASDAKSYDVTITNITHGQTFTPILVVSHKRGHPLFKLGDAASDELAQVAEGGDTGPLATHLLDYGIAYDTASSGGLLEPGKSVTVRVKVMDDFKYISVVSMLIPTNDAFFALNGVRAPKRSRTIMVPAFDAGSEYNDELCVNIPGPVCKGEGYNTNGGEGFVHIHPGISGKGDLASADYNWNNPTAKISIKRVK
jgi:hypothetical protein